MLEWLYSKRVSKLHQLLWPGEAGHYPKALGLDAFRAEDDEGVPLSDAAVLEAADFGVFIDLASMCQKENDTRTDTELALFKAACVHPPLRFAHSLPHGPRGCHPLPLAPRPRPSRTRRGSLGSLDVICAHKAMATLLSTRLPEGVEVERGYDDRGWTCFERAESQLIKPGTLCINIGLFSVDKACKSADFGLNDEGIWSNSPTNPHGAGSGDKPLRIGASRFADRTVAELAMQGAQNLNMIQKELASSRKEAPLAPEAFAELIRTKKFTDGADATTVIELYTETATALLGTLEKLSYRDLEWPSAEYVKLGKALRYCVALEELELSWPYVDRNGWTAGGPKHGRKAENVLLDDACVAAMLAGPPLPSIKKFALHHCVPHLTALPSLDALVSLEVLTVGCHSLTTLRSLDALTSLKTLDLNCCSSLTALPSLDALGSLETINLNGCLSLRALPSLDALVSLKKFTTNGHAGDDGGGPSITTLPSMNALVSLEQLELCNCYSLTALPSLDGLGSLTRLNLSGCSSLTALPSLDGLGSLTGLNLSHCSSLTALPSLDALGALGELNLGGAPHNTEGCSSLTALPSLDALGSLETLNLSKCTSLVALPSLDALVLLKELNLSKCSSLTSLPSLDTLAALTTLELGGCSSLTAVPSLDALRSLKALNLATTLGQLTKGRWETAGCASLTTLPPLDGLVSLTEIDLRACSLLTALPEVGAGVLVKT